jgi:hypothetical protein
VVVLMGKYEVLNFNTKLWFKGALDTPIYWKSTKDKRSIKVTIFLWGLSIRLSIYEDLYSNP